MTNREAFEKAAYNHYLQRKAAGKIDPSAEGDGTPEAMFWRDENGNYGVLMFNAAMVDPGNHWRPNGRPS